MPQSPPILAPPGSTLEARVAALEKALKRVAAIANGSLQIGPNQKSPVPGELIAGRITSPLPSGQPSMTLDLMQTAPGLGPRLVVNDGTRNRVQAGNLLPYTDPSGYTSPGGYDIQVVDKSGNLVFDSLGAIRIALLSANNNSGGYVGNISAAWTTIVSTTFTLTRQTDVLVWAYVNYARTAGTTGDTFLAEIVKDSDPDNSVIAFPTDASFQSALVPNDQFARTFTLIKLYQALSGAAHTIYVRGYATGDTFQAQATINVISLGGIVGG